MIGARVGNWYVEAEISRGPLGVVYRARGFEDPERHAAVKVFTEARDPALIERMRELTSLPRIIVHSAASLAATVQAGAQLHAMAVLRKPTDWMEMRKILEQCRVEVTQGARAG